MFGKKSKAQPEPVSGEWWVESGDEGIGVLLDGFDELRAARLIRGRPRSRFERTTTYRSAFVESGGDVVVLWGKIGSRIGILDPGGDPPVREVIRWAGPDGRVGGRVEVWSSWAEGVADPVMTARLLITRPFRAFPVG